MLLENDTNLINGSTVLAPQKTALPKEKVRISEEAKKRQREELQKERVYKALKFAGCLGATFAVSFTIIFRYSTIYSNQKDISKVQSEIYKLSQNNESLKVGLLKYNNLSYIEEVATKELKMVQPIAGNAVRCNLKLVEASLDKNIGSTSMEWLKKIKDFLF